MLLDYFSSISLTQAELARKYRPYLYAGYKGEDKPGTVYLIKILRPGYNFTTYKVGFTSNTPEERCSCLFSKTADTSKYTVEYLDSVEFVSLELAYKYEQRFHKDFKQYKETLPYIVQKDIRSGHSEFYSKSLIKRLQNGNYK